MCKYCSKLKELRNDDLVIYERDINHLNSVINSWRRHVYKAESIMQRAIDVMQNVCSGDELTEEDICDMENSVSEMRSWISIDYVGK